MARVILVMVAVAVLVGSVAGLWGVSAQGQAKAIGPINPEEIQAAYKEMEARLISQLKDPALWTDDKQKEKARGLIQEAGEIRSVAAIPVLIEHLHWTPFTPTDAVTSQRVLMEFNPAVNALAKIGLPAVPELLKVIQGPARDRSTKEQDEAAMAVAMMCLFRLYDEGGQGRDVALHRVALEAAKSSGEAKERLQKALKMFEDPPARK
jgi:hypothetical protein